MKILIVLLLFSSLLLRAAEPIISKRGELIYEESFSDSLSPVWMTNKEDWYVENGRLIGQGNEQVVHLSFSPEVQGDFIIELDMRLKSNGGQAGIMFNPGEDCTVKRHLGRAILTERFFAVRMGKSGSIKKEKSPMPTRKWFRLTLESLGGVVAIQFNKKKYTIKNEDFKKVNKKKVILLAGKTVEYRNLKIYEAIQK